MNRAFLRIFLPSSWPSTLLHSSLRPLDSGVDLPDCIRQSKPDRGRKNGMTMIELLAALALFVVILGILTVVLNRATEMWSAPRSLRQEQVAGEQIADMIAADLYQAVTDNAPATNSTSALPEYPTFILRNHPVDAAPADLTVILGLIRPAQPRLGVTLSSPRLSVDAVFYTVYANNLFRTVVPLPMLDSASVTTLGTLLKFAEDSMTTTIPAFDPSTPPQASDSSVTTLLAERVIPSLSAKLPPALAPAGSGNYIARLDQETSSVFIELTHCMLPDLLDISLHIYTPDDWASYQDLINHPPAADEFAFRAGSLGTLTSRRITLPQAGGSRLP